MRYFMAFFAALLLLFLLIFLLFHGGGKPRSPIGKTLYSYSATDAEVRLTIDGPINADQDHRQARITVSSSDVTFDRIQGYDGNVINTKSYANTDNAYAVFLLALAHAGFTNGNNDPQLSDERGYCPLGDRYIFELIQDNKDLERYWATNCGSPKTYLGSLSLTLSLFEAQVPNYSALNQDLTP